MSCQIEIIVKFFFNVDFCDYRTPMILNAEDQHINVVPNHLILPCNLVILCFGLDHEKIHQSIYRRYTGL